MLNKRITPFLGILMMLILSACSTDTPVPTAEDNIPHLTEILNAMASGNPLELKALLHLSALPCSKNPASGVPLCIGNEAEGTPVSVFPINSGEQGFMRQSDLDLWGGTGRGKFFAAFRTPDAESLNPNLPAGQFGMAFKYKDELTGVILWVSQEGIVSVDYLPVKGIDDLVGKSEVVLNQDQVEK